MVNMRRDEKRIHGFCVTSSEISSTSDYKEVLSHLTTPHDQIEKWGGVPQVHIQRLKRAGETKPYRYSMVMDADTVRG